MIRYLTAPVKTGERVRHVVFQPRSHLPVSAASLVANAVREALAVALRATVDVRVSEPVVPEESAWPVLLERAALFRVRGAIADAIIVVRPGDALRFITAAFAEGSLAERPLSAIEERVLARAAQTLAPALAPICGAALEKVERIAAGDRWASYFEIVFAPPLRARLGVALTREPQFSAGDARVRPYDVLGIPVELSAELAAWQADARSLLALRAGVTLDTGTKVAARGALKVAETTVARGHFGTFRGRFAFLVDERVA
ncbi:MAG: FliM/FliN family flagellar motor switch protein [Candidatus Eremiobacteraeota bacterium]|nr:FliM/FliN family flagellar motor switch protein [Candidatus Eremiobacteraeota bacterium]